MFASRTRQGNQSLGRIPPIGGSSGSIRANYPPEPHKPGIASTTVGELTLDRSVYEEMAAHCLDAYPLEGCGLLAAAPGSSHAVKCYGTSNAAASSRVYTIDPKDHLRADRDADDSGLEIMAVFHSHTHTEAFPSPTDVGQAPVPEWHYVLVSLANAEPEVRSFRILDGNIKEESVVILH